MMSEHDVRANLVQDEVELLDLQRQYDQLIAEQGRLLSAQYQLVKRMNQHRLDMIKMISDDALSWFNHEHVHE